MSRKAKKMERIKFITVLKYCWIHKIDRQKLYRIIREHKLKPNKDFKYIKRVVSRLHVREDLII